MICNHVFEKDRPINLVMRDQDGMLLMLCGEEDHDWETHLPKVVGLGHLLPRDDRLAELEIDAGYEANLVDGAWIVRLSPEEED